jgi:hypothetical protein
MMQSNKNKAESPVEWIAYELQEVSLGDKRLDWRILDSAVKLAAAPSASIPQACDDWADTKATYRLFDNPKTTAEKIRLPHQIRTKSRLSGHKIVLVVQDSSYLDYSHHPAKSGVGPIGTSQQTLTGLVMHSALAMTTTGLPLGVLSQVCWAREEEPKQMTAAERRKVPIEEKESYKWLRALNETMPLIPTGTQAVTVGDSEADIFELFAHVCSLQTDMLIRAGQNRSVCDPEIGLLWPVLDRCQIAGHLTVQVAKQDNQPAREALVSVRFSPVTLKKPQHLSKDIADIALYAVLVQEEQPPAGITPLCWLLLTTVPVLCLADAIERIAWYCQRWQIELYHKVLKSGCQVEKSQLATTERLLPLLALYSIIAWRLCWMTYLARHDPDAPCTAVLTDQEWRPLYTFIHKTNPPPLHVPTVRQVILWIARLGGFLARRSDGDPGVTVIWRGWQRLSDIASAWLIFAYRPLVGKG